MGAAQPIFWVRDEISAGESVGRCRLDHGAVPYMITLGLINLSSLALALYQGWNIWDINTEFSESRHISMAFICTLSACTVGIPVSKMVCNSVNLSLFIDLSHSSVPHLLGNRNHS